MSDFIYTDKWFEAREIYIYNLSVWHNYILEKYYIFVIEDNRLRI